MAIEQQNRVKCNSRKRAATIAGPASRPGAPVDGMSVARLRATIDESRKVRAEARRVIEGGRRLAAVSAAETIPESKDRVAVSEALVRQSRARLAAGATTTPPDTGSGHEDAAPPVRLK